MVSKGASSTYVRPKRKSLYIINHIELNPQVIESCWVGSSSLSNHLRIQLYIGRLNSNTFWIIILMWWIFWKCGSLEISWRIDERSSSSILRTTISEPQTGIEPAPSNNRWDALAMGYQDSDGQLNAEIVFLRIELDERSSIVSRYLQAATLLKYVS